MVNKTSLSIATKYSWNKRMGTDYYIYLRVQTKNGGIDWIERAHIGRNATLNWMSLHRFFRDLLPRESEDWTRLKQLNRKVRGKQGESLSAEDAQGFFEFMVHLGEHYLGDNYYFVDEYITGGLDGYEDDYIAGHSSSWRESLSWRQSDSSFKSEGPAFTLDGLSFHYGCRMGIVHLRWPFSTEFRPGQIVMRSER